MSFDKIKWNKNNLGEDLGFLKIGKYCLTAIPEKTNNSFEVQTYEITPLGGGFLKQLGARPPIIQPEHRVKILDLYRFLNKKELIQIIDKLRVR